MSTTVKFTISDENYAELISRADAESLSVQDYIRKELFSEYNIITPKATAEKALTTYKSGETFTVPQVWADAWNLPNGTAGQFGRKFNELVKSEYSTKIRFTDSFDSRKHAIYEVL